MLEYERPKRASAGKYVGQAEGYGMRWRYHALECIGPPGDTAVRAH
jgi:hypothetical protein